MKRKQNIPTGSTSGFDLTHINHPSLMVHFRDQTDFDRLLSPSTLTHVRPHLTQRIWADLEHLLERIIIWEDSLPKIKTKTGSIKILLPAVLIMSRHIRRHPSKIFVQNFKISWNSIKNKTGSIKILFPVVLIMSRHIRRRPSKIFVNLRKFWNFLKFDQK